jgi:hypothetical protein
MNDQRLPMSAKVPTARPQSLAITGHFTLKRKKIFSDLLQRDS